MSLELVGSLALFLLGIDRLADGLRIAAGDQIKTVLGRFTSNRISGALTGAGVTALIQSSSVTTVLVVGFVSAGLMSLTQSIGVIFGANIGTTVTAQIAAFKIGEEALPLIAIGFLMTGLLRTPAARHTGSAILGLGLLFFGMEIMGDAMRPLRTYEPFLDLLKNLENPVYAIAIAALFTALVQSSSATTGIVIVMASEGVITLPLGIAFALGANIGTCATAGLAAIGKTVEAQRAAVVHVLFNITGALIWVAFIDELIVLALAISPSTPGLFGADLLAADAPRQIANANTLFNVINAIFFLPLAGVFASIVVRLVPERREPELLSPQAMPARGARLKSAEADGVKLYRLEYDLMEALKRTRRHLHRARVQLETLNDEESGSADRDRRDRGSEADTKEVPRALRQPRAVRGRDGGVRRLAALGA